MKDELRDYYLELAFQICDGVTSEHYEKYVTWYYQKKRNFRINPIHFISLMTKISCEEVAERLFPWHIEKGNRVEKKYEKIKID